MEETPALFLIYKIQNILDWIDQFLKTWYSRLYENLKYTFLKMYRKDY